MNIGERIRLRREELGISMDELAIKLGYKNRSSIYKVEVKGSDIPNDKLEQYAKVLGTTVEWLLGISEIKDKDLADYIHQLQQRPELKMFFTVTEDASKEQVQTAVELIKVYLRGNNGSNNDGNAVDGSDSCCRGQNICQFSNK